LALCCIFQDLRKSLNAGKSLGKPDGVLINGKGPYRYNDTLIPDGIEHETIKVHPGKVSLTIMSIVWYVRYMKSEV